MIRLIIACIFTAVFAWDSLQYIASGEMTRMEYFEAVALGFFFAYGCMSALSDLFNWFV